jgi:tetratricopeptide (TPR) repeat protein
LAAVAFALVVGAAVPALAQGKWAEPYDAGVAALQKGKWQEAIDDFTKAIAIDPRAQAHKITEGVYGEDYFPYYYRALAYANLQNYAKAKQDFQQARQTRMSDALMKELDKRASDVDTAIASQQAPKPAPPQPSAPPAAEPVKPPVVAPAAPVAPDPRVQAAELVKKGNTLLGQGKPMEAQKSFQDAQKLAPQAPGVQEGLVAVANRGKYEQLKNDAAQDRHAGKPADAITKYGQARTADPQQYAADHLDQQLQLAENDLSAVLQRNDASARVLAVASGANLLNAGRELARQHRYAEADAKFQASTETDPANHEAADALTKSREYAKLMGPAPRSRTPSRSIPIASKARAWTLRSPTSTGVWRRRPRSPEGPPHQPRRPRWPRRPSGRHQRRYRLHRSPVSRSTTRSSPISRATCLDRFACCSRWPRTTVHSAPPTKPPFTATWPWRMRPARSRRGRTPIARVGTGRPWASSGAPRRRSPASSCLRGSSRRRFR